MPEASIRLLRTAKYEANVKTIEHKDYKQMKRPTPKERQCRLPLQTTCWCCCFYIEFIGHQGVHY
eukprot:2953738-Pleurochrysis_carterae.AAC.1